MTEKYQNVPRADGKPPMPLVEFCRRGVGEWNAVNPSQLFLTGLGKDIPLMDKIPRLAYEYSSAKMKADRYDHPRQGGMPETMRERNFDCLYLTQFVLRPENPRFPPTVEFSAYQEERNVSRLVSIQEFCQPTRPNKGKPVTSDEEEYTPRTMSTEGFGLIEKEKYFWFVHLRDQGPTIVCSLMKAIEELAESGQDQWILPTGDVVSAKAMRIRVFEISAKQLFWVRALTFVEREKIKTKKEKLQKTEDADQVMELVRLYPRRTFTLKLRRKDSEYGLVRTHYVISVTLPTGKQYVFDPTGLQYGFRGPRGTIIPHGFWEAYRKDFPGIVMHDVKKPRSADHATIKEETLRIAEGKFKLVTQLAEAILHNLEQKSCDYCGRTERGAEATVGQIIAPRMELTPCVGCKKVAYCNPSCRKLDNQNHKEVCAYNETHEKV